MAANEHGSVLQPATLASMFEPQYQPDPRVPGIGLAFSRFDLGGHLAVEHEGILPGFNSQIFVAPDDGVGVMAFTNGARRAMLWLPAEVGRLLRHLLGVPDDAIRTDVPHHPEIWGDLCGWYQLSARVTDTARLMLGAGAEVFVRGGRLRSGPERRCPCSTEASRSTRTTRRIRTCSGSISPSSGCRSRKRVENVAMRSP